MDIVSGGGAVAVLFLLPIAFSISASRIEVRQAEVQTLGLACRLTLQ